MAGVGIGSMSILNRTDLDIAVKAMNMARLGIHAPIRGKPAVIALLLLKYPRITEEIDGQRILAICIPEEDR